MTDTNDHGQPLMPTDLSPGEYRARITRDAEGNIHWETIDAYHPVTGQLRRMTTTVDHLAGQMRGTTLTLEEFNQIIQAAARLEARLHKLRGMAESRHYDPHSGKADKL
jgi:hypothetical protein